MNINEITDHFNDQVISGCIELHNDIVTKLNEKFEDYKTKNPHYFLYDNSRFKNEYDNKLTKISLKIKSWLQDELKKDLSFEIYIDVLQRIGLDFFITPRVLELRDAERLQLSEKKWRLDYSSKSIKELRSIVSSLEKSTAKNDFEKLKLKTAKNVLNSNIISKSRSDLDNEIKGYRNYCLEQSTKVLRNLIFDESGKTSEDEKKIIRLILKERHKQNS